jgi:hypothetical protein
MIQKLLRMPQAALLWTKALESASRGRYHDVIEYLKKIELLGIRYFEYDILGGVAANRLGEHALAIDLFERAEKSIRHDRFIKEPVRQYLLYFIAICAQDSAQHGELDIGDKFYIEPKIALDQVPNRIKRNFPLENHLAPAGKAGEPGVAAYE